MVSRTNADGDENLEDRSPADLLKTLLEALDSRQWALADRATVILASRVNQLVPADGKNALDHLHQARRFRSLQLLAGSMIRWEVVELSVHLRHVQSLLGQGEITASQALLDDLLEWPQLAGRGRYEVLGLIGEASKQASLAAPTPDRAKQFLRRAFQAYTQAASEAGAAACQVDDAIRRAKDAAREALETEAVGHLRAWLCYLVNTVALLARANRKEYPIDGTEADPYATLARPVLDRVNKLDASGKARGSEFAAAIEACVALGDLDGAAAWARRLTTNGGGNTLEIGTVLGQLVEVWELDEASPSGRLVLPALKAALLEAEGGHIAINGKTVATTVRTLRDADLEKVFGSESFVRFNWYLAGVQRCRAIARFETTLERGMGSGLLIRGSALHPNLGERRLVLTNAHVLSSDESVRSALRPGEARVTFQGHEGPDRGPFRITKVLWTSSPDKLDVTLAALERVPENVPEVPFSETPPTADGRQRIYAIGHPGGESLSLSLHDNLLLDFVEPRIHYRTPTDHGSSGSPLFDSEWNLIGLHHAGSFGMRKLRGGGVYEANEGIWIGSIVKAILPLWSSGLNR